MLAVIVGTISLALSAAPASENVMPELTPKPYIIGIAPSHITTTPDPLFQNADQWEKTQGLIDFYKYYSLQYNPPAWSTKLTMKPFVEFTKAKGIGIDSEYGNFVGNAESEGKRSAKAAIDAHQCVYDNGGEVRALHLDGPMWRMIKKKSQDHGLLLDRVAEEIGIFYKEVHAVHPKIEIGIITNYPNWDQSEDLPGMLGGFTDATGVTYAQAIDAVYKSVTAVGEKIDFLCIDCPYNYFCATKTLAVDGEVDNVKKFKTLQSWCYERDIKLHIVFNYDAVGQMPAGIERDKEYSAKTLEYIRHIRREGIFPDAFIIQSWYKWPEKHMPEDEPGTFMNLARDAALLINELYPRP